MRKPEILIVDDDPAMRDILRLLLEHDGWRVSCASDGEEAIQQLTAAQFDIIVLDLLMPRMNGTQVLEFMAARQDNTPVVVVSGASSEQQQQLDPRIVRVRLQKPFEIGELRVILRAIVDTAATVC